MYKIIFAGKKVENGSMTSVLVWIMVSERFEHIMGYYHLYCIIFAILEIFRNRFEFWAIKMAIYMVSEYSKNVYKNKSDQKQEQNILLSWNVLTYKCLQHAWKKE